MRDRVQKRSRARGHRRPAPRGGAPEKPAILSESEHRFWVALATAPIVVFNQDRALRYTWIGNPALGLKEEEALGRTDEELLGVAEAKALTAIKRRVLKTGKGERREVRVTRAGQSGWFDLLVVPRHDARGRLVGITCAAVDVSERKRMEEDRASAVARLAMVAEYERHRIARELHDQTAQRLAALAVELKTLETNLAAGRSQAGRLRLLRRSVDELQLHVRRIAWELRDGELAEGGLENAVHSYLDEWSERARVPAECECRGLDGEGIPEPVERMLYRLVQETLANVERHARARRVSVLLERDEKQVRLTVEDDGCGFDADSIPGPDGSWRRLGLLGMKERVALAGGTLLIESSPGSGTTVLARIPLSASPTLP